MLKIVVCIKAVPDPDKADQIIIDPKTRTLVRHNIPMVINPMDRFALEAALNMKSEGPAHITVMSMGPKDVAPILKECMALGADKGLLLSDPAFAGADTFATARTLAAGIAMLEDTDLILCGMASSDGATEWVGPQIAAFINRPVVTMVREIESRTHDSLVIKADVEKGYRRVRVDLPAVLTVTRELNTPKTLSFSGIVKARKKQITCWGLRDLDLDPSLVGAAGSPTRVSKMEALNQVRQVKMVDGTREEKVDWLVNKLRETGRLG